MTCPCCAAARETSALWRYYELSCLWCGARLIQRIGKLRNRTTAELTQRRRAVLADWTAYGHSESEIRALVALKTLPLEPATNEPETKRKK